MMTPQEIRRASRQITAKHALFVGLAYSLCESIGLIGIRQNFWIASILTTVGYILSCIVLILGLVWILRKLVRLYDYISYLMSFILSLNIIFYLSLIVWMFYYLWVSFINPQYPVQMANYVREAQQVLGITIQSERDLQAIISMSPLQFAIGQTSEVILYGVFFSIIVALFFVKKGPTNYESR